VTTNLSGRRVLAAPILGPRGGGIGQVSAMLWEAMRTTWPDDAGLVTLLGNGHVRPHAADKIRFGLEFAGRQLLARPSWVLFSHLGLARVERYVPAMLQTPYAVFLHGIEAWKPLGSRERTTLRGAAIRIANSKFTADAVARANPGIGPIDVCPLALSPGRAMASRHEWGPRDSPTVLVVGRLASSERYKGHEPLIRAWPAVRERVPEARLVIAGDGDDVPRLRRLAAECGVAGAVDFLGFVSGADLDRAYARAAVFAMPSKGEGFGLVYLEAMAHGLPCIGSVHDAAREVIDDGTTGLLVDPDDQAALAATVAGLLESPGLRGAMGAAGQALVRQQFGFERFKADVVNLLASAFSARATVA
jgi:phosphatidylinositol alpha-1,6-mannosyltransferase